MGLVQSPLGSGLSGLSGISGVVGSVPQLLSPSFSQLGATPSKQGDSDMLNWACGPPLVADSFGKLVFVVQQNVSGTKYHVPIVSNDAGATWAVPTLSGAGWSGDNTLGDQAIVRLHFCHDPTHDQLAAVVVFDQTDGVYARFWTIGRDGSNNITSLTRARQMQLEAGVANVTHDTPLALWLSDLGALWFSWSAVNPVHSGRKGELRATFKVATGDAGDTTQANWKAPMNESAGAGSTDGIGSTVTVKYSALAISNVAVMPFAALDRLASKDIGFYAALGGTIYWNRAQWSAANSDWRTGLVSALTADAGKTTVKAFGAGGYANKHQLMSKPAQESGGKVALVFPWWNGSADVVSIAYVDPGASDGLSSIVDVYNAGGAHSYAPSCDCAYDSTSGSWLATYIKTTTQQSYVKRYSPALGQVQAETALHAAAIDIPYVYGGRLSGKTVFYDRDTTSRTAPDKYYAYLARASWG
jgi:hypothetical protein